MEYENTSTAVNKLLNDGGLITTFAGAAVDLDTADAMYKSAAPFVNKFRNPDGSIATLAEILPGGGGGGGPDVISTNTTVTGIANGQLLGVSAGKVAGVACGDFVDLSTDQTIGGDKYFTGSVFALQGLATDGNFAAWAQSEFGGVANFNDRVIFNDLVEFRNAMVSNINMDGYRVINLNDPVTPLDAATKGYVDNADSTKAGIDTANAFSQSQSAQLGSAPVELACFKNIYAGTTAMTAGTTPLATGTVYLQYE